MSKRKRGSRFLALCALTLCAALLTPLCALGQAPVSDVTPAPTLFKQPKRDQSQTVRVRLTRWGTTNRLDLTADGRYAVLLPSDGRLLLERGAEITVTLDERGFTLYCGVLSWNAGESLTLKRYAETDGSENGLRRTDLKPLYAGDLHLSAEDGAIVPVLHIHVEDYLLGVVPYEMNDEFPLEALKVQAIAARTYALYKQDPKAPWDVVDNTNDQVYKGAESGNHNARQAIEETRGVCGFYRDKLALCYYSASNGGQTELPQNAWKDSAKLGYFAMADDPWDLANPMSTVKRVVAKKAYTQNETASYGLRATLANALADTLTQNGYDVAPESLRIDGVSALSVDTPEGGKASRLMTKLHITFRYAARTKTGGAEATQAPATPLPEGEVSLFSVQQAPTQDAQAAVYGPFEPAAEPVTLVLPLFPDNELISVVETDDAFTLEARRYGHGVGMSQRGAQWMALTAGKSYTEILAFYYPGMELKQYAATEPPEALEAEALETPGPRATPTPRPTLMPVSIAPTDGAWIAVVTEIDDDSTLNLRSLPDMSGEVLMRLYKHQRLLVLQRCPEEGWVKVKTDVTEGYVMERFLTAE